MMTTLNQPVATVSLSLAHEGALRMASMNIPVFPLWGILDGKCTCGAKAGDRFCKPGKHPRRPNSFKEATTDPAIIDMWFKEENLNFGVRTGVEIGKTGKMLVVIDVDRYKECGADALDALIASNTTLPETAEVLTGGGGNHLYFLADASTAFAGTLGLNVDFKVNGYVVGPGSLHVSGKRYEWEASSDLFSGQKIADLPEWIVEQFSKSARTQCSVLPALCTTLSAFEVQNLRYELTRLKPDPYSVWLDVLMALKSTGDEAQGFHIADEWSRRSSKYTVEGMGEKWQKIDATGGITLGTLYDMTRKAHDEELKSVDISGLLKRLNSTTAWPQPEPIGQEVESTAYPLNALPPIIRDAVMEVQQFVKAPVAMVACSAMATVSLACQARNDVERARGLTGPVGLYLLTVADSGERKSTLDGHFSKPIRDYEKQCMATAAPLLKEYAADMAHWSAVKKGLEQRAAANAAKDDGKDADSGKVLQKLRDHETKKPIPPVVPRLIYGDTTPEALLHGIAKEWPSVAVMSSEGGVVFGGHGMSKESQIRNLATINELWDGKAVRTDRRASDSSYTADGRMTIAIQVQAPTLKAFFEASGDLARGTGFLARFLIAWPESTQGTRRFSDSPVHWPMLERYRGRLTELLNLPQQVEDGHVAPAMLSLTVEAKNLWIAFHDEIEDKLGPDGELHDVRDVASKIADNAARIAALFHVIDGADGSIGANHMANACCVASWHLNESRRLLGGGNTPAATDAVKIDRWLRKKFAELALMEMPFNVMQKLGPGALRKKEQLESALSVLSDLGRVRVVPGQPRMVKLNPALLKGSSPA